MTHDILPPFPGFRDEAFAFLRDLAANNQRDWFKPRKDTFDDELIWPLRCLVADLSRRMTETGLPLTGDPSKSLFRIYRDVRFSKNKDPYKRHVAAVLSRSGSRKESGGLYIHVEPGNCFAAAGYWQPPKELLHRWRERLVTEPAPVLAILDRLKEQELDLLEYGMLKRLPRGFTDVANERVGQILRHKSFMVSRSFKDGDLARPEFSTDVVDFAQTASALLRYGWRLEDELSG